MSTDVTLTVDEWANTAHVGVDRYAGVRRQNRQGRAGQSADAWDAHLIGAWPERVIAKATNTYWPGTLQPDNGEPDVGPWHVRGARRANGKLRIHPWDAEGEPFVLVVPRAVPTFRICGWLDSTEARRNEWWTAPDPERPPAWFVPQDYLRPFEQFVVPGPGIRMLEGQP